MTISIQTDRPLFVTLPVADVERSKAFFSRLGFGFDPAFSGETAACMKISEHASVMLGSHEAFQEHSHRPMGDPATHALALFSFGVSERDDVDAVAEAALAAGPEDHGFMYTRSFFDLDGHGWQVMWLNPEAA
jgi:uncharacterized protein